MPLAPARLAAILLAYFLIYVVWGSTYYVIGVALREIPPFLLGAWRFSIAGLVLLILCALRGERIFAPQLLRRSAVSGIVLLFVDMAVIMLAQRYITSSLVAILASSTAIWIMLLDLPERRRSGYRPRAVAGLLIGFAGVAALYAEQLLADSRTAGQGTRGILLLIAGCISWALGTLYAKYRSPRTETRNTFAGAGWQMIFAAGMFWAGAALTGESLSPTELSPTARISLLYLIFAGSLLAYTAYIWLLSVRPAAEVATHAYVNPVVAILLGLTLGHESVSPLQIIGLIVILTGVLLIELPHSRSRT